MKLLRILLLISIIIITLLFTSCKKDDIDEPTLPTALFTVSPPRGTTNTNFAFDASGSTDKEDPTSNLQVRWDFDNNGSWDTSWDYDKTQNHQYGSENTYIAKLEVKDTEELTDQYTQSIIVNNGCEGQTNLTYGEQTYDIVKIGNQCWMAENLNYETTNSWWYDNSNANGDIYGRLYTWSAAMLACPPGWHLPSDDEWKTLEIALGMSQSDADRMGWRGDMTGKMKETGTAHWNPPNTSATNSSGFTALPGGYYRYSNGSFHYLRSYGYWWTSTTYPPGTTGRLSRSLYGGTHSVYRSFHSGNLSGFSVRCLKDN